MGEEGVDGLGYYYLGAYSMLLLYIQVKDFFNIESYWVSIKVNLEKLDLNFFWKWINGIPVVFNESKSIIFPCLS